MLIIVLSVLLAANRTLWGASLILWGHFNYNDNGPAKTILQGYKVLYDIFRRDTNNENEN